MFFFRIYKGLKKRLVAFMLVHILYRCTPELQFPLDYYQVNGDVFGKRCQFDGVDWGYHLGEGCNQPGGTPVRAIGSGRVVYSALHPGREGKRNWGNIVIIVHKNPSTKEYFFSVYGHLRNVLANKGDAVEKGEVIAEIARPLTDENGMWDDAQLFLGIYTGPWHGNVLPGYYREDQNLTRPEWWQPPGPYISSYRKKN